MRVARIIAPALLLIAAGARVSAAQLIDEHCAVIAASEFAPTIDIWLDKRTYHRGVRMRPHFSTEPGAHVVIVRVSPKGELWVMYPLRPGLQKPYALALHPDDRMPSSEEPGSLYKAGERGFVFAIASYQPFDFGAFRQGNRWDGARFAKFARYADPFGALRNFVDEILPSTAAYSLDCEVYETSSHDVSRNVYQGDNGYVSRNDQRRR
ncbi:MAG: hypothetical protein ACSLFK_13465 [Gemmatimonadaceae bacterium]